MHPGSTWILDLRRRTRMSQDEVAYRSGLDRSVISRAERGLAHLRSDQRQRLLEVFKAAMADDDAVRSA